MIWHSQTLEQILDELKVDHTVGLSATEAEERLDKYGYNLISEEYKTPLPIYLLRHLKAPSIILFLIVLGVTIATSVLIKNSYSIHYIILLGVLFFVNYLISNFINHTTKKSLKRSKARSSLSAHVLRDGKAMTVSAADLVPGDIIILEEGDFVPADARIIESQSLHCNESVFTNDSIPVEKMPTGEELQDYVALPERYNMLYFGTSITSGEARAVVTETGNNTELSRFRTIHNNQSKKLYDNHTYKNYRFITRIIYLSAIVLITVLGILFGNRNFVQNVLDSLTTALVLTIILVPKNNFKYIDAIVSIGLERLIKNNALIKDKKTFEKLKDISIICSDKTGTLTDNNMKLRRISDLENTFLCDDKLTAQCKQLLLLATLCCDASINTKNGRNVIKGDPTELGIIKEAERVLGITKDDLDGRFPRLGLIPLDSIRKRKTSIHLIDGKIFAITKGSPDILLDKCINENKEEIIKLYEEFGSDALRTLGICYRELDEVPADIVPENIECDMRFLGLFGLSDSVQNNVAKDIEFCKGAGIEIVMFTGDHLRTAGAFAKSIGLANNEDDVISDIELENLTFEELNENVEKYKVFARTSPLQRVEIIKALQYNGHIVAATGDGPGDAEPLTAADIGCAMGINGTDISKNSADIIINDDSFSTIVRAIAEAKNIFRYTKKYLQFLLVFGVALLFSCLMSSAVFGHTSISVFSMLLIGSVFTYVPIFTFATEKPLSDALTKKCDKNLMSIETSLPFIINGALCGIISLIPTILSVHTGTRHTMSFVIILLSLSFVMASMRTDGFIFNNTLFTNKILNIFLVLVILFALIISITPICSILLLSSITFNQFLICICISLLPAIFSEAIKYVRS